jgi:hypothetical protein
MVVMMALLQKRRPSRNYLHFHVHHSHRHHLRPFFCAPLRRNREFLSLSPVLMKKKALRLRVTMALPTALETRIKEKTRKKEKKTI